MESTAAAAPAQQFLLRNGLMKLICYIYLKKDREMSWCHCQKRKDFEKFFYYYTQKLSIRFHERSKGSNNMKYINKDLDDFVFKKLFDGQGSEVDFVFPLKKYTYIQKDWVDIDSKLSQNWVDNESSLSQKRVKIEVIELMLCKKKMTVLLGWETKKRVSALYCISCSFLSRPQTLNIMTFSVFFFGSILLDCVKLWLYTLVLKDRYFSYI